MKPTPHCWSTALSCTLALALLAGLAHAHTFVVDDDGGPGVDFTDIGPAIVAAQPGDLLLIQDGTYGGFVLSEGLRLVAAPGASVVVDGGVTVFDLPADQAMSLSGMDLTALVVDDCLGPVALDRLGIGPLAGAAALSIGGSHRVTLSRCDVLGQTSQEPWLGINSKPGAVIVSSSVQISQSSVRGGSGGSDFPTAFGSGTPGAPGLDVRLSTLVLQTSDVRGGHGGWAWDDGGIGLFGDGGDGAPALLLDRAVVHAHGRVDDVLTGGDKGQTEFGQQGTPAPVIQASRSDVRTGGVSLVTFGGVPTLVGTETLFSAVPAQPVLLADGGQLGTTVELTLTGQPGAQALLWVAPGPSLLPVPTTVLPLLIDPAPLLTVVSGTLDGAGQLSTSIPLPVVAGAEGLPVHLQAGLKLAPLGKALSTSATLVLY